MNTEIEAKFLNINHHSMRKTLQSAGAKLEIPSRLMKRAVIHTPAMTKKNAFIRVRDEGNRITVTYKQFDSDSLTGAKEHETVVESFDEILNIFKAAGLEPDVFQETRRENWTLNGVEIMLDEWPWLAPYVEIEGASEHTVKETAKHLGLVFDDAVFGGVANAYLHQYPHIGADGVNEINQNWKRISFDEPAPALIATE